ELREHLQDADQRTKGAEKERGRGRHEAPLLPHQRGESTQHELGDALALAPPVSVERVVPAQRELVQPVDQRWAVTAIGREREALAEASVARGHFRRRKRLRLGIVEKVLQIAPLVGMRGFEGCLLHLPAMWLAMPSRRRAAVLPCRRPTSGTGSSASS